MINKKAFSKQEQPPQKPNEVYSEVELIKDSTKPISFRVDSEVYRKIATLEKIKKEPKSTIIKEAIDSTFTTMMFRHMNSELYKINKEVFPEVKLSHNFMMGAENRLFDDEEKDKNPFNEKKDEGIFRCVVFYHLKYPVYESEKEHSIFSLNNIYVELINEGSNIVKIKVVLAGVLSGNIDKVNQEIFTKISLLGSKEGFQIETNTDKKTISQNLFFERRVDFDYNKWLKKYKEDMESFKKTIETLNDFLKTKKELKISNKKSVNAGAFRLLPT